MKSLNNIIKYSLASDQWRRGTHVFGGPKATSTFPTNRKFFPTNQKNFHILLKEKIANVQSQQMIKSFCQHNKWDFLDHKSIDPSCLNARGLHLNRKGTTVVAKNITDYISN